MLSRIPTRCKHCRIKFTAEEKAGAQRIHSECVDLWLSKQLAKQAAAREKKDRAEFRERKAKLKRISELIAAAQTAFNAFIRERDKDKGCFVCGRPFLAGVPGRVQHAGHVRSRGAAGHLRYDEDNCMGECEGCNGPHGAKPHQIKAGAIARIGAERFEELEASNEPHKWERDELIAIKALYVGKLKELKRSRG
jgi:hypothetical protein